MSNSSDNRIRRLEGRVALVTGGGTGIGREIALLFAREGARVAVCGRRLEPLEAVRDEIRAAGGDSSSVGGDVGDESDVIRIVRDATASLGAPTILVNNASIVGQVGAVTSLERDTWDDVFRINITGPMLMCKHVIPGMRDAHGGTIVNVSSNVGRRGFPNRAPYVCSKWALHGLTQTVALETASFNIRVNAICPGPVMTERLEGSMQRMAVSRGVAPEELRAQWEAESPMGRFATAGECASVALFLASDASSGMTGQALNVTAGVVMT